MSWMTTFTGRRFDPLYPEKEALCREDIAHALSMLCRANGHLKHFYPVAQHSVNCAEEALARGLGREIALFCLLHDASESYLSDVIRPLKEGFARYQEAEDQLQDMIWEKYLGRVPAKEEREAVFAIDDAMLVAEFGALMGGELQEKYRTGTQRLVRTPDVRNIPPEENERRFLALWKKLEGERDEGPLPVYFAGSIRGGRNDASLYAALIAKIQEGGRAKVLTEHVGSPDVSGGERALTDQEIWERDMAWIRQSRLLIAECSQPSLGVGYELAEGKRLGIPCFVLYGAERGRLSAMIAGDDYYRVFRYADGAEALSLAERFVMEALCGTEKMV